MMLLKMLLLLLMLLMMLMIWMILLFLCCRRCCFVLSRDFVVALAIVFNDIAVNIGVTCVVGNADGVVVVADGNNATLPC